MTSGVIRALTSGFAAPATISCRQLAIKNHRRFGYAGRSVRIANGFGGAAAYPLGWAD